MLVVYVLTVNGLGSHSVVVESMKKVMSSSTAGLIGGPKLPSIVRLLHMTWEYEPGMLPYTKLQERINYEKGIEKTFFSSNTD